VYCGSIAYLVGLALQERDRDLFRYPRMSHSDAWVFDRIWFELLNDGNCSCCASGFSATVQDLIAMCSDIDSDMCRDAMQPFQQGDGPDISILMWQDRVKMRKFLKGQTKTYRDFWSAHGIQTVCVYWEGLSDVQRLELCSVTVQELHHAFRTQFGVDEPYQILMRVLVEQMQHWGASARKVDGIEDGEIAFEFGLAYDPASDSFQADAEYLDLAFICAEEVGDGSENVQVVWPTWPMKDRDCGGIGLITRLLQTAMNPLLAKKYKPRKPEKVERKEEEEEEGQQISFTSSVEAARADAEGLVEYEEEEKKKTNPVKSTTALSNPSDDGKQEPLSANGSKQTSFKDHERDTVSFRSDRRLLRIIMLRAMFDKIAAHFVQVALMSPESRSVELTKPKANEEDTFSLMVV
jgi:hypothetical protein